MATSSYDVSRLITSRAEELWRTLTLFLALVNHVPYTVTNILEG